mmetsp:Transcript_55865/g.147693  ORF Transcript_55865/g.147693 Transcript_55865/m.147693 type:complete len:86 (-) Transcript_55865:160-417(-)
MQAHLDDISATERRFVLEYAHVLCDRRPELAQLASGRDTAPCAVPMKIQSPPASPKSILQLPAPTRFVRTVKVSFCSKSFRSDVH